MLLGLGRQKGRGRGKSLLPGPLLSEEAFFPKKVKDNFFDQQSLKIASQQNQSEGSIYSLKAPFLAEGSSQLPVNNRST